MITGSEYESSDEESMDFDDIGLDKEELEKILNERKGKEEGDGNGDDNEDGESSGIMNPNQRSNSVCDDSSNSIAGGGGKGVGS